MLSPAQAPKKPQLGWLGVVHFLQVWSCLAGNSEPLGEITQKESKVTCFTRNPQTPGQTSVLSVKHAAIANRFISWQTWTQVLEKYCSTEKLCQSASNKLHYALQNGDSKMATKITERNKKGRWRLPWTRNHPPPGHSAMLLAQKNLIRPISTWRSTGSMRDTINNVPWYNIRTKTSWTPPSCFLFSNLLTTLSLKSWLYTKQILNFLKFCWKEEETWSLEY